MKFPSRPARRQDISSWASSEPAISAVKPIFSAKDCLGRSGYTPWKPGAAERRPPAFTNDSLGLYPGCEAARQACLDLINHGQVADGIMTPARSLRANPRATSKATSDRVQGFRGFARLVFGPKSNRG